MQINSHALAWGLLFSWLLTVSFNVPKVVKPVQNFSVGRYLDRCYEIA